MLTHVLQFQNNENIAQFVVDLNEKLREGSTFVNVFRFKFPNLLPNIRVVSQFKYRLSGHYKRRNSGCLI